MDNNDCLGGKTDSFCQLFPPLLGFLYHKSLSVVKGELMVSVSGLFFLEKPADHQGDQWNWWTW